MSTNINPNIKTLPAFTEKTEAPNNQQQSNQTSNPEIKSEFALTIAPPNKDIINLQNDFLSKLSQLESRLTYRRCHGAAFPGRPASGEAGGAGS